MQYHNVALLEKVAHLENNLAEVEDKNKRLTTLVSDSVVDKANAYKENVLTKLLDKKKPLTEETFGNEKKVFSIDNNAINVSFMA